MKCRSLKLAVMGASFIAATLASMAVYLGDPAHCKNLIASSRPQTYALNAANASRQAYVGLLTTIAPQLPPQQSDRDLLAPYFGDHMVFQRNQPLRLWGRALPGSIVRVSAIGRKFSVYGSCSAAANGDWFLALPIKNAVGAFTIDVKAGGGKPKFDVELKDELTDVIFGDVFLCAGQSNMMMNLRSTKDCSVHMFKPGVPVRIVNMGEGKPCTREWTPVNEGVANLAEYSALATVFADNLADKSGVPIGIVQVCAGGTSILHWIDPARLPADVAAKIDKRAILPIYRYCVAPLERCFFKAAIWYQGESDLEQAGTYQELLTILIKSYRQKIDATLPFFVVQLPSIGKVKPYYFDSMVARLREAQATVLSIRDCYCLTSYDTVDSLAAALNPSDSMSVSIHPLKKKILAERLADAMYLFCYQNKALEIPRYVSPLLPLKGCVKINITQTGGGLKAVGGTGQIVGFTIAGADRKFHLASARILDSSLIISSHDVPEPVAVRYLWADKAVGNLFAKNQLPVQPFRTDNWPLREPYADIREIVAPQ